MGQQLYLEPKIKLFTFGTNIIAQLENGFFDNLEHNYHGTEYFLGSVESSDELNKLLDQIKLDVKSTGRYSLVPLDDKYKILFEEIVFKVVEPEKESVVDLV